MIVGMQSQKSVQSYGSPNNQLLVPLITVKCMRWVSRISRMCHINGHGYLSCIKYIEARFILCITRMAGSLTLIGAALVLGHSPHGWRKYSHPKRYALSYLPLVFVSRLHRTCATFLLLLLSTTCCLSFISDSILGVR